MARPLPRLSVVVASRNSALRIRTCLDIVLEQCHQIGADCVVVDASIDATRQILRQSYSQVPIIVGRPSQLVPELWSMGIQATRGEIVALTIAQCVPANRWLEVIADAPWNEIAGMGGAIELQQPATLNEEAVFYLRYSGYMLPQSRQLRDDLAGDNAAYRRDSLETCRHVWQAGFWETFVHQELKAKGMRLLFDPAMLVYFRNSASTSEMLRQRFLHGRFFGAHRVQNCRASERVKRIVTAPAIPVVLLARIVRRLRAKQRLSPHFVLVAPRLLIYLLSWSAGEFSGYAGWNPESRNEIA